MGRRPGSRQIREQGGDFPGYSGDIDFAFIGKKCREMRKARGLTQKQVAGALAVSAAYVGHLERNEKKPSVDMLIKLCNFYSVKLDHLFQEALPQHEYVLNEQEKELMDNHRKLEPEVRDGIESLVRKIAHNE